MGGGVYVNGQKYVSLKDACFISGYTSDQIELLCLKGKLKSWCFGSGRFIEEGSFIECLKELSCLFSKENIQQERFELDRYLTWRGFEDDSIVSDPSKNCTETQLTRFFSPITGFVAVMMVTFIFILSAAGGEYVRGGMQNMKINIANVPSSYNSTRFIDSGNGMIAAVGKINDTVAEGVETALWTIYKSMAVVLTGVQNFIFEKPDGSTQE